MASKRTKEQKWSPKPDSSSSPIDGFADTPSAGNHTHHFGDRIEEGPSMEEILASLEGLLDADNEALLGTPPAPIESSTPHSAIKFDMTTLKGFENDANLEQELLESLALPAYGDGDFSEEETPVDLHGFEWEQNALATRQTPQKTTRVAKPLSVTEKTQEKEQESELDLIETVRNEPDPAVEDISVSAPLPDGDQAQETVLESDNMRDESEPAPESMAVERAPEPEMVTAAIAPAPICIPAIAPESESVAVEIEPESVAIENEPAIAPESESVAVEMGPESVAIEDEPAIVPEPESVAVEIEPESVAIEDEPAIVPEPERVVAETEPKPEQVAIEHAPEPERVAEVAAHSALTAELLRAAYGERVERIVGEMAQQIMREILPGLLEEAIRAELDRIKNL